MFIPTTVSTALALVLALPFWLAGPAQAAPISFGFSGHLDSVDPALSSVFLEKTSTFPGQFFSGNFTYESSAMPSSVTQGSAAYNAVTAFQAQVQVAPSPLAPNSKITFTTIFPSTGAGSDGVIIFNAPPGGGSDQFTVRQFPSSAGFIGSKGSIGGSGPLEAVAVVLIDHSGEVFNAVSPLPTSLDLARFKDEALDVASFALLFGNPGNPALPFLASGELDSLAGVQQFQQFLLIDELAPVPEPVTLLLFGTTMAGLGLTARWRQRRRK